MECKWNVLWARGKANWHLVFFLRLALIIAPPHHYGVEIIVTHVVTAWLVPPLRIAVPLLVALARSAELPQGTTGENSSHMRFKL